MLPQRFFWRAFLAFLALILIASLLSGLLLYRHLYDATLGNLKNNLRKETELLAEMAEGNMALKPVQIAQLVRSEDRISIIALDGTVLADTWADKMEEALENHADRPEFKAAVAGHPIFVRRVSRTLGLEMLYYAVPLKVNNQTAAVLRLSFPLTTFYDQMASIRDYLLLVTFLTALMCIPFAFLLSRGAIAPLQDLRDGATKLASGNLSQRVHSGGSLEFQELATSFNRMAEQLQHEMHSLQQEHRRIETLLSKMVEGVLAIDSEGKAVFANSAFCEMMGLKPEKIESRALLEIIRNNALSEYISALLHKPHGGPESREISIVGSDGERIFSVQTSRIEEETGSGLLLLLLVFHDITRIKRVEQVRRDFVANVSHEFRTPLTSLKGSTEILLDGAYEDPTQCKKFLVIMDKQLRNLQNLVEDMLKLAAVEDSRALVRRESITLDEIVSDVVALLRPLARQKNQELTVDSPDESILLNVDPQQITDALMNLLDNAVKYTQTGGKIGLICRLENGLILQVKDNGPGISPEQLQRVFERFYRVDKSRSREMGGTGLGLAIVRHAVENHGGTVQAESGPGGGTTFTIHLPESALLPSRIPEGRKPA